MFKEIKRILLSHPWKWKEPYWKGKRPALQQTLATAWKRQQLTEQQLLHHQQQQQQQTAAANHLVQTMVTGAESELTLSATDAEDEKSQPAIPLQQFLS